MLSDDEIVPDTDEADEIRDFEYYADLAERWLDEAQRFTPDIFSPRRFEHAMKAADVYSRLAAATPKSPVQHDPDCCCLPENKRERTSTDG